VTHCLPSSHFVFHTWIQSDPYNIEDDILQIGEFVVARR